MYFSFCTKEDKKVITKFLELICAYLEKIFFNPFGFESVSIIRGGAIPFRVNSEVEDCKEGGIISSSLAVKSKTESLDWREETITMAIAMQIGDKTKN